MTIALHVFPRYVSGVDGKTTRQEIRKGTWILRKPKELSDGRKDQQMNNCRNKVRLPAPEGRQNPASGASPWKWQWN
jgi:hypothetical protein